ncbi:hypothetical protein [Hydrogenophilus thermoluteolus]|uniref:hypothetical protein n=1 Tax=Hydrogenophilus thermoluteolus TaxID=297 RepID=UPI003F664FF9
MTPKFCQRCPLVTQEVLHTARDTERIEQESQKRRKRTQQFRAARLGGMAVTSL